ncbi:MAG: hypothetical protein ACE5GH_05505, partial [Fidelibacterota bacterium]
MSHLFTRGSFVVAAFLLFTTGCENEPSGPDESEPQTRSSSASYNSVVTFSGSQSSATGAIYEVLPGPAAMNPAMDPTPFSNNTREITGSYSYEVQDRNGEDSESSEDSVVSVDISFTAADGRSYKIDQIDVIHKAQGAGDHTFFGGVGFNKMMHGTTGMGTGMMPKMLSYITLWGLSDLKDATADTVVAENRIIHIMTATRVRDDQFNLVASAEEDSSDHNIREAETHIILPPLDMMGNMSPVPGTDHGFIHLMFEKAELTNPSSDWTLVYEVLPGPAAINPAMSPTPFSDNVAIGGGSYTLTVTDATNSDSEDSEDSVDEFTLTLERADGTILSIDGIEAIHKAEGTGDHTFYGGVGFDELMHGDTGIGIGLMPRMLSYITVWGTVDLKDGDGNVLASDRLIHIMVASRARTDDLTLITATSSDETDHDPGMVETHIIIP